MIRRASRSSRFPSPQTTVVLGPITAMATAPTSPATTIPAVTRPLRGDRIEGLSTCKTSGVTGQPHTPVCGNDTRSRVPCLARLFTGNHHASASVTCLEFTRKGVCVKRGAVLLAVAASLIAAPDPAAAKGSIQARGYAVITGPDLSHPIVYSAPWDSSKGGYYSDEAEIFLNLATYSGAIPAGRDLITGGGSVPDGVLPMRLVPGTD